MLCLVLFCETEIFEIAFLGISIDLRMKNIKKSKILNGY
jgi:hypothetical protein